MFSLIASSRLWARKRRLEFKGLKRSMFMFYFDEANDMELVLSKSPWNFNNSLVIVKQLEPGVHPSQLSLEASPCWL